MKKVLLGATLGMVAGYFIRKMQEEGEFEKAADCANKFAAKTKKKAKNLIDAGQNEAEYLKERVDYILDKGKEKFSRVKNDISEKETE